MRYVVIDTETTGLNQHSDDMLQICILPVDIPTPKTPEDSTTVEFVGDPFVSYVQPRPKVVNSAYKINNIKVDQEFFMEAMPPHILPGMIKKWWGEKQEKICILAHNWSFDLGFIKKHEGLSKTIEYLFGYHSIDSMVVARHLYQQTQDDRLKSASLTKLTASLGINPSKYTDRGAHDALFDCYATALVYTAMINEFPLQRKHKKRTRPRL